MQVSALNVQPKSVTANQPHPQLAANQQSELHHSQNYQHATVEIGLLSCFIGSFLLAITLVIQYRKYRVRMHQQRIVMLERLWKLSLKSNPERRDRTL